MNAGEMKQPPCAVDLRRTTSCHCARLARIWWKRFSEKLKQTAELGKVDVGGGGTIAYILALYGMNVIDCGVPVLSMHSPWEATSKADLYEAYRGYKVFLKNAAIRNQ